MTGPGALPDVEGLGPYQDAVDRRLADWTDAGWPKRLWAKDATLWPAAPPSDPASRLGWLALPTTMRAQVPQFTELARAVRADGLRAVVVLGMGGSSLAPALFGSTFAGNPDGLPLHVLDSTHPAAVAALARSIDPGRTLFVVSSKSGTTLEPNAFLRFFWERVAAAGGPAGSRFVAITDPGTPLETLARAKGFRAVVLAPPDVGGRYSALTPFGLLPAALAGLPIGRLLDSAEDAAHACGADRPPAESPGFLLGAVLGELARAGRDKVTFVTTDPFAAFPDWAEQLIAESTGKAGKGIVPVAREPSADARAYGGDRLFVTLESAGRPAPPSVEALRGAGHPVVRWRLDDRFALGAQFFVWEVAIALAGAVLGIDPFDQPDVEIAKELAREAIDRPAGADRPAAGPRVSLTDEAAARAAVVGWADGAGPTDYLAIQAYLEPTGPMTEALETVRGQLLRRTRRATTLGYGPRFLHSTGQLHKGGPPTGRCLQLVDAARPELAVPEMGLTFGRIISAQAEGDLAALVARGRTVLSVDLGENALAGVGRLAGWLRE